MKILGIDDRAVLAVHVVEHAIGIDHAISLPKHHVSFQVDFQRNVVVLELLLHIPLQHARRPHHDVVGRDVELLLLVIARNENRQTAREYAHAFVLRFVGNPTELRVDRTAGEESQTSRANDGRRFRRGGLRDRELRPLDHFFVGIAPLQSFPIDRWLQRRLSPGRLHAELNRRRRIEASQPAPIVRGIQRLL